ncbi:hypothetical protein ACIBHX_46830 [Nonomuraea sp. NPDC050536]|uniref:hypothetical protein n=1 Tax=Nonomuraea sp. NPDC050536 TaxID=3364366 RepID=UPI0037C97A51
MEATVILASVIIGIPALLVFVFQDRSLEARLARAARRNSRALRWAAIGALLLLALTLYGMATHHR